MSNLILKAEGEAFAKRKYDLRAVDVIISNYTKIIDRSVPILLGHKNLTPDQRSKIRYEVEIRPGSLEILLQLMIDHKEDLAALFLTDPTNMTAGLAKIITDLIGFRRKFAEVLEKGLKPKVVVNSGNYLEVNNSGTIIINDPTIIIAADATRPALDKLIRGVDGKQIEDISLNYKDTSRAKLTSNDIKMTGSQKEELPSTIQVVGRLDSVNFSRHRGSIVSGSTKYQVRWDESLRGIIQKCVDVEGVLFTARPVIDHRRVRDNTIGFHLLDCQPQQRNIFTDSDLL